MGVKGLNTYLETYCEPYKLHDTLIIVDGGLAINMCLTAGYDPRFGGNYQRIYEKTCKIFKRFLSCNIIPIVVDDGRFKDEKARTIKKRHNNKLKLAISYKNSRCSSSKATSSISLLYGNAFRHALNDLGIPFCCTEFEADEEIMELARKLNCPVLSCDSDFYLSDGVGFVHWDSINFDKRANQPFLWCEIFQREKFLKENEVSGTVFPFLSVLFSSDYSEQNYSERLFPGVSKGRRFEEAMIWLRGKTVQDVLRDLTRRFNPRDVQDYQNKIMKTINSYSDCKTTVIAILERNEKVRPYLRNVPFNVQRNDVISEYNVPKDVINKIKECRLTSTILDFFVSDEFECKTMVCEDVDEESAHAPSVRLIQGIYGVLLPYLPENPVMRLKIRHYRETIVKELNPLTIRNRDPYKILYEIMEIDEDLAEDIRLFDDQWIVFIVTLIYWRKQTPGIDDSHIHSVILTAFACHVTEIYKWKYKPENCKFPLDYLYGLTEDDCRGFVNKKINSWSIPKKNRIALDSITHIHVYLSFQACLHRSQPLVSLLDLPYDIRVSDFICGDWYHGIYTEMKRQSDCMGYVNGLLRGYERLRDLYGLIVSNRAVADLL